MAEFSANCEVTGVDLAYVSQQHVRVNSELLVA